MNRVALLTPPGRGAIATIAVAGPDAWAVARQVFQRGNGRPLPTEGAAGRFWFGRAGGEQGDEVILALRAWQPEVWTEYHCHGGNRVVEWLIQQFTALNCQEVGWEPFIAQRLPVEKDGECLGLLAQAKTFRTASILLDQFHGSCRRAIEAALAALQRDDRSAAKTIVESILRFVDVGLHLTKPWRIAVAGAPNAGKSSLINALAGYQRSVVAPMAGTTRDVVTTELAFQGWPVALSDTAGMRPTTDPLEREGVARARGAVRDTDLCLRVIDVTAAPPVDDESFAAEHDLPGERILTVLNKSDLAAGWDVSRFPDAAAISAQTGAGIPSLIERILRRLIEHDPEPGAAVPYSKDQVDLLRSLAKVEG